MTHKSAVTIAVLVSSQFRLDEETVDKMSKCSLSFNQPYPFGTVGIFLSPDIKRHVLSELLEKTNRISAGMGLSPAVPCKSPSSSDRIMEWKKTGKTKSGQEPIICESRGMVSRERYASCWTNVVVPVPSKNCSNREIQAMMAPVFAQEGFEIPPDYGISEVWNEWEETVHHVFQLKVEDGIAYLGAGNYISEVGSSTDALEFLVSPAFIGVHGLGMFGIDSDIAPGMDVWAYSFPEDIVCSVPGLKHADKSLCRNPLTWDDATRLQMALAILETRHRTGWSR